jgi:hypothetical protein
MSCFWPPRAGCPFARATVDFDDANVFAPSAQKPGFWVLGGRVYSQQSSFQFVEVRGGRGLAVIEANMGFGWHKTNQVSRGSPVCLKTVLFFG